MKKKLKITKAALKHLTAEDLRDVVGGTVLGAPLSLPPPPSQVNHSQSIGTQH